MRLEDRLSPLLYAIDDSAPQRSYSTVDEVLAKAQFLSSLLYQIHCIGPVGFGFTHIYSEGPLKLGPYKSYQLTYYDHSNKNVEHPNLRITKVGFNKNKNNDTFTTFSQYFYNKSNVVSCY